MGEWADYWYGAVDSTTTTVPKGLSLDDFGFPDPQDVPGWAWGHAWSWIGDNPVFAVFLVLAGIGFLVVKGFRQAVYGR